MITAPLEAIGATDVEISPDRVRVHFAGSANDATAWTPCSAVKATIGDRVGVLVYSDGELDCDKRDID